MANTDRPNGFRFAKSLTGAPVSALARRYEAGDRSADTTNNHGDIYLGDPVTLTNGRIFPANSGDTVLGVAISTGTDSTEHGQVNAFNADNLEVRYLAADQDGFVWVIPAEQALFEIQTSSDLDLDVGSAADFNLVAATAHGNRVTSNSNVELVVASNNDIEIVENVTTPENDITMANARHLVRFTETTFAQTNG